jgi:hypothetical protein
MVGMWEASDSSHSRRCPALVTGMFRRIWRFYCLPTTSKQPQSCDPKAADGKNPLPSEAFWKALSPTKIYQKWMETPKISTSVEGTRYGGHGLTGMRFSVVFLSCTTNAGAQLPVLVPPTFPSTNTCEGPPATMPKPISVSSHPIKIHKAWV